MKSYNYNNPRCVHCNKFMSWKSLEGATSWIPYGGPTDMEEPEPEYCHAECWEKMDVAGKDLIHRTSWIKPHQYFSI